MSCTVCRHPRLVEIDGAMLAGTSNRSIAKQWQITPASVQRHKKHVSETLRKAHAAAEVGRADSLIDQLKSLQADAHRIKSKAEKSRDYRGALAGIRELSRLLQVSMKVSEQLIAANKGTGDSVSPEQAQMCRHAAHLMGAAFHADDRVVLVITEKQANDLAAELALIFGIQLESEVALQKVNTGLALLDDSEGYIKSRQDAAAEPAVGRRF
jgi:hypothetical protein